MDKRRQSVMARYGSLADASLRLIIEPNLLSSLTLYDEIKGPDGIK
jgi:hypothetical protein